MECLIIGGTGTISEGIAVEAIKKKYKVTLLNRGNNNSRVPNDATVVHGDINDIGLMTKLLGDKVYDVIVDPITYNLEQLK